MKQTLEDLRGKAIKKLGSCYGRFPELWDRVFGPTALAWLVCVSMQCPSPCLPSDNHFLLWYQRVLVTGMGTDDHQSPQLATPFAARHGDGSGTWASVNLCVRFASSSR